MSQTILWEIKNEIAWMLQIAGEPINFFLLLIDKCRFSRKPF